MKLIDTFDFSELLKNTDPKIITPEWNIEYYTKLLKYTKKTVKLKKIQKELDWWLAQKE